MTTKWQDDAMLLVAAFLLGLFLAQHSGTSSNSTIREKEIVRARPDTVRTVIEVPTHSLHLKGTVNRTRIIVRHDTVYRAACLDTLIAGDTLATAPDTLSVCYARNAFSISLGFSPRRMRVAVPYLARDTFYWRNDSIRATRASGRAWYDNVLLVIVSIAAGMIVGKL